MDVKTILLRDYAKIPKGVPETPSYKEIKDDDKALKSWAEKYHKSWEAPIQQQFRDIQIAIKGLKQSVDTVNTNVENVPTADAKTIDAQIAKAQINSSQISNATKLGSALISTQSTTLAQQTLGLGSSATQPSTAFATVAQGGKADTAVQPADITGLADKPLIYTVDTDVTNVTSTYATGLTLALPVGKYIFELIVVSEVLPSSILHGFKYSFSGAYYPTYCSQNQNSLLLSNYLGADLLSFSTATGQGNIRLDGVINVTTAGTFLYEFKQITPNISRPATIYRGSYFKFTPVT